MDISKELMEKAMECQTAEELVTLAKENDYELSLEEAESYINSYVEGEAADEELDKVAGGQGVSGRRKPCHTRVKFARAEDVQYIAELNANVHCYAIGNHPGGGVTLKDLGTERNVRVLERFIEYDVPMGCYYDKYKVQTISGEYAAGSILRDNIIK